MCLNPRRNQNRPHVMKRENCWGNRIWILTRHFCRKCPFPINRDGCSIFGSKKKTLSGSEIRFEADEMNIGWGDSVPSWDTSEHSKQLVWGNSWATDRQSERILALLTSLCPSLFTSALDSVWAPFMKNLQCFILLCHQCGQAPCLCGFQCLLSE